jgi:hypothetical protein
MQAQVAMPMVVLWLAKGVLRVHGSGHNQRDCGAQHEQ